MIIQTARQTNYLPVPLDSRQAVQQPTTRHAHTSHDREKSPFFIFYDLCEYLVIEGAVVILDFEG